MEKDSLYDFLAIGEKLKLKGLAKTPEHSASQVDIKISFSSSGQDIQSKDCFFLLFSEDVAQTQTSKNMNKGCSPLLVIIQKSDAKEQWGENVLQKMFLCPEVEFIVYLMNLTKFISHIHNLIRGSIYPRILPRKLHYSFPLSLFPRLEKQSWVAFVPRERKNNVTAVEIWRSWNLRRRSRFTPLPLSPSIALQFEKKKGLRSNIVFKHIYFLCRILQIYKEVHVSHAYLI